MNHYSLRPIGVRGFASHEMLLVIHSFGTKAQASERQRTIDYLARQHGMNLTTTRSLRYDPTFMKREGINVRGDIRIGPLAFRQDCSWLANVIFHEVIHSDQFHFYKQQGVVFGHHEVKSEPERAMIALDEFEGFYWPWRNGGALGLNEIQKASLAREIRLWQIEIDDPPTVAFVRQGQFKAARLALIERWRKHHKRSA